MHCRLDNFLWEARSKNSSYYFSTMWFIIAGLFLLLVAKPILVAKQLEWAGLKTSDLDWTLVRPPKIVEGKPTGSVLADEKNLARTQINVDDLADFMLAQITSKKWIRKAPLVASSSKK